MKTWLKILVVIATVLFWVGFLWGTHTCPEAKEVVETTTDVVAVPSDGEEVVEMIGSNSDPETDTYFPELSCSHLPSCTISEVPLGYFTIGFTSTEKGCDWVLFKEGESIDFDGLDEIHTYNALLPLTALDAFIRSQTPWVLSCSSN